MDDKRSHFSHQHRHFASECAFHQTNLGVDQKGESEEPAEDIGDSLTGAVEAGMRLSFAGGVVNPGFSFSG
jgi:hypothetical protein